MLGVTLGVVHCWYSDCAVEQKPEGRTKKEGYQSTSIDLENCFLLSPLDEFDRQSHAGVVY